MSRAKRLIESPEHRERVEAMREKLFGQLEAAGAVDVRFQPPVAGQADERLLHPND